MDDIEELIVEEDRPEHIAKHKVKVEEVGEVLSGEYVWVKAKLDRWKVIGKTKRARFLAIIVGKRHKKGIYGLVTARPAKREERDFYYEFTLQLGGAKDGEN